MTHSFVLVSITLVYFVSSITGSFLSESGDSQAAPVVVPTTPPVTTPAVTVTPTTPSVTLPPVTTPSTTDSALIGVKLPLQILAGEGPLGGDRPPLVTNKDKPWSLIAVGLGPGSNIVDLQVLKFPVLPRNSTFVKYYNGSAYTLILDSLRSWMDSLITCKSYGLEPVPIHSKQEFSFLVGMMMEKRSFMMTQTNNPNAWTGGNDILEEGVYTNIADGSVFPSMGAWQYTSNWGCGYAPYVGKCTTENCLELAYYSTFPYMINDRGCESPLYTLCKEKSYQ